jgi:adenine-specific DNA-methyltransferase
LAKTKQAALLAAIAQLSPEVLRDGQVDFEALKAQLGADNWAGKNHYELSWAGKAEARMEVQKTTSHTITPDVGADAANLLSSADHVFIEGENLDVLRVLQKSYWGKVKMIYIDPPYNTGNDSFIYPDKYSETLAEYQRRTGERNADGYMNKRSIWKQNSKESGQYHSAWLSMMYPRLSLARNLLREDGVIFISIDDNEAANLKLLCDEIFGAENFVGIFSVNSTPNARDYGHIGKMHEYVFFYCKNIQLCVTNQITDIEKTFKYYDEKGGFNIHPLYNSNEAFNVHNRPNLYYPFYLNPNKKDEEFYEITLIKQTGLIEIYPPKSLKNDVQFVWRWGKQKSEENINNEIIGYRTNDSEFRIVQKMRHTSKIIRSLLIDKKYSTRKGTAEVEEIFDSKIFDFPKPLGLLQDLIISGTNDNDLILDFFAGSGTTAHAVMQLNAEDGGNRRSISVQIPEVLKEDSEAYKAGYQTIADITRARLTKAAAKIKAEYPTTAANLDLACFKLAPSHFKVWQAAVDDVASLTDQLDLFQATEKTPDHAPINAEAEKQAWQHALLTELLLKKGLGVLGVDVQASPQAVGDATLYRVLMPDAQVLYLCFDTYTEALKREIVADKPAQVVLLNSCFVGDKADEQLSNLSLELNTWDCRLEVI